MKNLSEKYGDEIASFISGQIDRATEKMLKEIDCYTPDGIVKSAEDARKKGYEIVVLQNTQERKIEVRLCKVIKTSVITFGIK